jgi:hypothetical protein
MSSANRKVLKAKVPRLQSQACNTRYAAMLRSHAYGAVVGPAACEPEQRAGIDVVVAVVVLDPMAALLCCTPGTAEQCRACITSCNPESRIILVVVAVAATVAPGQWGPTGAARYSTGGRAGFGEVFWVWLLLLLGRGSLGELPGGRGFEESGPLPDGRALLREAATKLQISAKPSCGCT